MRVTHIYYYRMGGIFMDKKNVSLLVIALMVLFISACTSYNPKETPTGNVVDESVENQVFQEGDDLDLRIESLTSDDLGVGNVEGLTILVPNVEVDNVYRVRITKIISGVG